mgnify:FL=1
MYRLVLATFFAMPSIALAQGAAHEHRPGMNHPAPIEATGSLALTEPGQATFAAIQEIVSLLEADPDTDWSTVNIDALHRHLVDMDNVTLRAEVETTRVDSGFRYVVTGAGAVRDSIARMVKGHAATASGANGMTMVAEDHPGGAVMIVTAARPEDRIKLAGLGFFGLMTFGAHHQAHHLMIATGQGVHD